MMTHTARDRQSVLSTQYKVLSTQYLVLSLVGMAICAGCGPVASSKMPEESLAAKIAVVQAGKGDRIEIHQAKVGNDDLQKLGELSGLQVLLLDGTNDHVTAAGIEQLAGAAGLKHLRIRSPGIDDAAVGHLAKLQNLEILNLPKTTLTNGGLDELAKLPKLIQLRLGSKQITDAGMQTIARFPTLTRLHLIDVPLGDEGLRTLAGMKQLESLYIDGGHFSDQALEELFRARPDLHVHLNQAHHDRDPHKHDHP